MVGVRSASSGGEIDSPATVPPPPTGTALPPPTRAKTPNAGVAQRSPAGGACVTRLVPGISNGRAPPSSGEDEGDPQSTARVSIGCPLSPHRNTTNEGPPTLATERGVDPRHAPLACTAGLTRSAKGSTTIRSVTSEGGKYRPSGPLARHPLWDSRSGKSGRPKRQDMKTRFTCRRRRCLPPSSLFVLNGRKC